MATRQVSPHQQRQMWTFAFGWLTGDMNKDLETTEQAYLHTN